MSTPTGATLDWLKRPRYDETDCARRTIWETADHRYRVVHSRTTLPGLTPFYFAMAHDAYGWRIVSRHRKKRPAFVAIGRLVRTGTEVSP